MEDLKFEQRWLVIDVASTAELDQWDGVHQVCDPDRAATYMRIGDTRYRWEFRLLPGETAADFATSTPCARSSVRGSATSTCDQLELVRVAEYTFRAQLADRWREGNVFLLGDAAHLTPPFIGQGMGAGVRDAMNLAGRSPECCPPTSRVRARHLRRGAKTACSLHDRDGPGYGLGDDSGW